MGQFDLVGDLAKSLQLELRGPVMPCDTKLNETAQHQFIVAHPNAVGKSWCLATDKVKNDLVFFDTLLDMLTADYKIGPDRLHVVGISNGEYL